MHHTSTHTHSVKTLARSSDHNFNHYATNGRKTKAPAIHQPITKTQELNVIRSRPLERQTEQKCTECCVRALSGN